MKNIKILSFLSVLFLTSCSTGYESPKVASWHNSDKARNNVATLETDMSACEYDVKKMAYGTVMSGGYYNPNMLAPTMDSMRLSCIRSKGWEPTYQSGY